MTPRRVAWFGLGAVIVIAYITSVATVIHIAMHFIAKFW